jgi:hypothetical protein
VADPAEAPALIRYVGVLGLILVAATFGAQATGPTGAETISFRFAPPDGTHFVQSMVTTREKSFEGIGRQVDRLESETEISLRRSGEGYVMTAKPISLKMTTDGRPAPDPVSEMLRGVVLTYRIDRDGQIQGIDGYGGLVERARQSFPPQVAEALAPLLSEQALVARETAEWNGRIGDFAGNDFAIGDSVDAEVPFTLPNGDALVYLMRISFPRLEDCAAGSCVRVEQRYDSEADAVGKAVSETAADLASKTGADSLAATASGSRISGSASRLIDPRTMLIYGEVVTRTISMTMDVPGQGPVPTTLKEERSYSFAYR